MFLNKIDTSRQYPVIPALVGNENPFSILLPEMLAKIFSYTNLATLSAGSQVSKNCNAVINGKPSENDPLVRESFTDALLHKKVIYHTKVFGNKQWALCGGGEIVKDEDMDEEFRSFSTFMDEIMKSKLFVGKKMSDVLKAGVFVRIPKNLTTEVIGTLAKPYFPKRRKNGNPYFTPLDEKDEPEESHWVWMTEKEILYSVSKNYYVQQQMSAELGYKDPKVLEALACIFAKYCLSGTRLYEDIRTRCQGKIKGFQACVGFGRAGLVVRRSSDVHDEKIGIAGLLRSGPAEAPTIGPC